MIDDCVVYIDSLSSNPLPPNRIHGCTITCIQEKKRKNMFFVIYVRVVGVYNMIIVIYFHNSALMCQPVT